MVEIYIKHGVSYHNRTFITMHPLETYYLNHAGRDLPSAPENGPIYSAPIYLQRGTGSAISWALSTVWCDLSCGPWAIQVARSSPISRKIKSPDVTGEDIISKHVGDAVTESTRHLIGKLRGRGLKRARRVAPKQDGKKHKKTPAKCARVIKRDNFS